MEGARKPVIGKIPGPDTLRWKLPPGTIQRRIPTLTPHALIQEVISTVGAVGSGALDPLYQGWKRRESRKRPTLVPHKPGSRLPVLLIPGYFQTPANYFWLEPKLREIGLRNQLEVYNESMFGSIEVFADTIERHIAQAVEETGSSVVNIVAHSMAGLATREVLRRGRAQARVNRLITLGSPHRGTNWAYVGIGRCCEEMRPGHPFLRRLLRNKEGELDGVDAYAVVSNLDLLAPPKTACFTQRGVNLFIPNLGHAGYFFSDAVLKILDDLL